jgi:7SK snRNA methylphosphate capping enzyme
VLLSLLFLRLMLDLSCAYAVHIFPASRCLAPGGLLVLEPQPWKSYQAAVHKQGGTAAPFYKPEQLKLRPEGFVEFLTQRVGFDLVQQLSAVSQAAGPGAVPVKGFDRPILVLRKPAALAN